MHDLGNELDGPRPAPLAKWTWTSAPVVHEGAIYMHQAQTYLVEHLDWEGRIAYVRPVDVDYYTRASRRQHHSGTAAEEENFTQSGKGGRGCLGERRRKICGICTICGFNSKACGDVTIVSQATGYRRIKRYSHETLGFGEIDLPEITLETTGYWLIFSANDAEALWDAGILAAT